MSFQKVYSYSRITLVCLLSLLLFVFLSWQALSRLTVVNRHDCYYILPAGTTAKEFVQRIAHYTNFKYPVLLEFFIRMRGFDKKLKAGEYLFPVGSKINDVVDRVVYGRVLYHPFTIINGWNFHQIMTVLNSTTIIHHTLYGLTPQQVAQQLGSSYKTPEGLLSPNTYYYTYGTTDLAILQRAYDAMQINLQKAWDNRDAVPYKNVYQAVIVASMIEKEAKFITELPLISAVILNRLKKGMRLQIDPTVIYALGSKFKGRLSKKDLYYRSPYNTYRRHGLPPTPISMPSVYAIEAALHPADSNALYFVAKNDGSHAFSETLVEHNQAVRQYQKA